MTERRSVVLQLNHQDGTSRSQVARLPCSVAADADGVRFGPVAEGSWTLESAGEELTARGPGGERIALSATEPLVLGPWTVAPVDDGRTEARTVLATGNPRGPADRTDLRFDDSDRLTAATQWAHTPGFPPPAFAAAKVSLAELRGSEHRVVEVPYLALGAGLGSFVWVDLLRVCGVPTDDIAVVGFEATPYARYRRLCEHSQIPLHERLRSNSESCPDNIWGFPGYGLREAGALARKGRLGQALALLGQLVGEPDRADTYTPRAGDVFDSIDEEATRIGWTRMFVPGRIRALRQTDDGRYVAAVSTRNPDGSSGRAFYVSPLVHLALGYPGVQFLDDLRAYREETGEFGRAVNAYEDHEHVYEHLAAQGGTVLLRGRGIVASRILQRLHEVREGGADVRVVHLMRSRRDEGAEFRGAARHVENHWEFQPFNWPEACWGGDLEAELRTAAPERRAELLRTWGGTTTADRQDWRDIVAGGLKQGWYRIRFGRLLDLSRQGERLRLLVAEADATAEVEARYIIDATGLISSVHANPVLADLIERYSLPLNPQGRLAVSPSFELEAMRNGKGRLFVAGVCTLGGPYAPVDSFLGLQYSAQAAAATLGSTVRIPSGLAGLRAWGRWVRGVAP